MEEGKGAVSFALIILGEFQIKLYCTDKIRVELGRNRIYSLLPVLKIFDRVV
jgi:hypothetical protein